MRNQDLFLAKDSHRLALCARSSTGDSPDRFAEKESLINILDPAGGTSADHDCFLLNLILTALHEFLALGGDEAAAMTSKQNGELAVFAHRSGSTSGFNFS
jgi:hypothetical protein